MARLLGVEEIFELRDRLGRGDADRLVEIDPAVDLDARRAALLARFAAAAGASAASRRFRRGRRSMSYPRLRRARDRARPRGDRSSASIRACASKLSSTHETQIGANLRLTRWATSARSCFLCCCSAASVCSRVLAAERHDGDRRELQIRRHAHARDRHDLAVRARDRRHRRARGSRPARDGSIRRRARGDAKGWRIWERSETWTRRSNRRKVSAPRRRRSARSNSERRIAKAGQRGADQHFIRSALDALGANLRRAGRVNDRSRRRGASTTQ